MGSPFLEGLYFDLGRGQVSWLPGSIAAPSQVAVGFPVAGTRCVPCAVFFARSQWRDRAGFAPDFPSHQAVFVADQRTPASRHESPAVCTVRADQGSVVKGSR
jgi:hypothetical protein